MDDTGVDPSGYRIAAIQWRCVGGLQHGRSLLTLLSPTRAVDKHCQDMMFTMYHSTYYAGYNVPHVMTESQTDDTTEEADAWGALAELDGVAD